MQYRIQVFAGLVDLMGNPVVTIEAPTETMTVDELRARVTDRYPEAALLLQQSYFAINHTYALPEQTVSAGDELVIIPPVSGG